MFGQWLRWVESYFIEIIADPNFRVMYHFKCRASTYFAYSQGFVFQGKLNYILRCIKKKPFSRFVLLHENRCRPCVLSHSTAGQILSITAQSVCCQPHHSLTNQMRTVYNSHELISPNHLSSPELIYRSSDHSLVSRTYSHQILNCFTGPWLVIPPIRPQTVGILLSTVQYN